jgi:CRISPR/Cas system-associated exonuclease Cas4 (RecB family)
MSELSDFDRCRRKYYYNYIRGWVPRSASWSMVIGTAYHAALSAGYRAVQQYDVWYTGDAWIAEERAAEFLKAACAEAEHVKVDRDGKQLGLTREDRELLDDMIRYWFEQIGKEDLAAIETVLSVEEPAYIQIGNYLIRNTLDLCVKYRDQPDPVIEDHKTGDPEGSKAFLRLDIQTSAYYVAARGKYGRAMFFTHTFQDREVPPGFGHRPLTTASGKERSRKTLEDMSKPTRYIQRTFTPLNDAVLDAHTQELVDIIQEIDHAKATGRWTRTRIKVGPFACAHCPYFAVCTAERDGQEVGEGAAELQFILRGGEEWKALEEGRTILEVQK